MDTQNANQRQIVETTPDHIEAMVDMFVSTQTTHHHNHPELFCAPTDREEIATHLRGFLKPRNPFRNRRHYSVCWIVEGAVGGYLLYQLYQSSNVYFGKDRWTCFVDDIVVSENFRGKGGASMLLTYLQRIIAPHNNCVVSAQVWEGNTASEALFTKFGFKPRAQNFSYTYKKPDTVEQTS